jgi:RimJ/RimL family protein N-acetyltransferase/ADP-ribose pyrophosphatase YjhB (NUDIX family)
MLRRPVERDRADVREVLAVADVMWFPLRRGMLAAEADVLFDLRMLQPWADEGFGLWAVDDGDRVMGYVGLVRVDWLEPLMGEIEVGWRLHPEIWGRGVATRGGAAALRVAFDDLGLERVCCLIEPENTASLAVRDRLGLEEEGFVEDRRGVSISVSTLDRRRAAALAVRRFEPVESEQHDAKRRILDMCDSPDFDPLGRATPAHLTSSALVVDSARERVLLLWHEKLGIWVQPGGHTDGDWDLARSALREAREETMIEGLRLVSGGPVDLDVHRVEPPTEPAHDHHDVRYLVEAPPGANPQANREAKRFRWATLDELAELGVDSGLQRLARLGLAYDA